MSKKIRVAGLAATAIAAFMTFAGPAAAVTVGFERITSNSSADAAGQLSADVTDGGTGALVTFAVTGGSNPGANIAEIYFSDLGTIFLPPPQFVSKVGNVTFEFGGSNTPPELPGANNASPDFETTQFLVAEASGNNATGITVGESLTMRLLYGGAFGFGDVLAALDNGNLRMGLHVRSLLNGQSDSFVSTPPETSPVPLPAAGLLLLGGLGGLGLMGRRKTANAAA